MNYIADNQLEQVEGGGNFAIWLGQAIGHIWYDLQKQRDDWGIVSGS